MLRAIIVYVLYFFFWGGGTKKKLGLLGIFLKTQKQLWWRFQLFSFFLRGGGTQKCVTIICTFRVFWHTNSLSLFLLLLFYFFFNSFSFGVSLLFFQFWIGLIHSTWTTCLRSVSYFFYIFFFFSFSFSFSLIFFFENQRIFIKEFPLNSICINF